MGSVGERPDLDDVVLSTVMGRPSPRRGLVAFSFAGAVATPGLTRLVVRADAPCITHLGCSGIPGNATRSPRVVRCLKPNKP
jgi:hypothetical protein